MNIDVCSPQIHFSVLCYPAFPPLIPTCSFLAFGSIAGWFGGGRSNEGWAGLGWTLALVRMCFELSVESRMVGISRRCVSFSVVLQAGVER